MTAIINRTKIKLTYKFVDPIITQLVAAYHIDAPGGHNVGELNYHWLSCRRSTGWLPRHSRSNNVIHRDFPMSEP